MFASLRLPDPTGHCQRVQKRLAEHVCVLNGTTGSTFPAGPIVPSSASETSDRPMVALGGLWWPQHVLCPGAHALVHNSLSHGAHHSPTAVSRTSHTGRPRRNGPSTANANPARDFGDSRMHRTSYQYNTIEVTISRAMLVFDNLWRISCESWSIFAPLERFPDGNLS